MSIHPEGCKQKQDEAFEWMEEILERTKSELDRDTKSYGKPLRPKICYFFQEIGHSKMGTTPFDTYEFLEIVTYLNNIFFECFDNDAVRSHIFGHFMVKLIRTMKSTNLKFTEDEIKALITEEHVEPMDDLSFI